MGKDITSSFKQLEAGGVLPWQDMENKIRTTLNEIYFGKTKDIVNGLRSLQPLQDRKQQDALRNDLAQALRNRQAKQDS